jgi:large subunit ribosomal protein L21e
MAQSSNGLRNGTRRKLKKDLRAKFTVTPYLREFSAQQLVTIMPNPSSHVGMPHFRFKGAMGIIKERRGNGYMVEVTIGNKKKVISARPEHLALIPAKSVAAK